LIADFDGSLPVASQVIEASAKLESVTAERGLRIESFVFGSGEELRAFDARLQQMIPAGTRGIVVLGCAEVLPPRAGPHRRVVYLTAEEAAILRQP